MFSRMKHIGIVTLLGFAIASSMSIADAARNGVLGSTSEASFNITIVVPPQVAVKPVTLSNTGTNSTNLPRGATAQCVQATGVGGVQATGVGGVQVRNVSEQQVVVNGQALDQHSSKVLTSNTAVCNGSPLLQLNAAQGAKTAPSVIIEPV